MCHLPVALIRCALSLCPSHCSSQRLLQHVGGSESLGIKDWSASKMHIQVAPVGLAYRADSFFKTATLEQCHMSLGVRHMKEMHSQ